VTEEGHHIGAPDEENFEYGLDCILDRASRLIEEGKKSSKPARKAAGPRTRNTAAAAR
jgi:hypothetical protein